MITEICPGCGKLIGNDNLSQVTLALGDPVYCASCDDLALASVMYGRFMRAIALLHDPRFSDNVNKVLVKLIGRLALSMQSLVAIRKIGGFVQENQDPATILRAMYDAALQVEYILHDPAQAPQLAQDYMDFYEIERRKLADAISEYDNEYVRKILNSPLRAQNEAGINERFASVEKRFRRGKGYHDKWHGKDLRQFCITKLREEEYDFLIVQLHGATHSSPMALFSKSMLVSSTIFVFAGNLLMRVVGAALDYNGVTVEAELHQEIEIARQNLFAGPRW